MLDFEALSQAMVGQTVLCIGDLMLDEFVYGEVSRISPEAPAPVIAAKRSEINVGGAGNVARNIAGIGARCIFVGLVGEDELKAGHSLRPGRLLNRKLTVADVPAATNRGNYERPAPAPARFREGDQVRTVNINPETHTRLPRYARGKLGLVETIRGCHVYPDTAALGLGTLQTVLGSKVVTRFIERGREYNVMLQARGDARCDVHGPRCVEPTAAVREGIGRHVEDAHEGHAAVRKRVRLGHGTSYPGIGSGSGSLSPGKSFAAEYNCTRFPEISPTPPHSPPNISAAREAKAARNAGNSRELAAATAKSINSSA